VIGRRKATRLRKWERKENSFFFTVQPDLSVLYKDVSPSVLDVAASGGYNLKKD
jgi:hypothetical protein